MSIQSKFGRWLTIGFSVTLLLIHTSSVWGQEQATTDTGETVAAIEVPDTPGEAANPNGEEPMGMDPAALTNRVFLPVIQGGSQGANVLETENAADSNAVQAANFQHSWVKNACTNVLSTEGDLWADMPGPGGSANNEGGLIWLMANSTLNETCTHSSTTGNLVTGAAWTNQLKFRVAVNDGAQFSMTVYRLVNGICTSWLTTTMSTAADDSQYRTYTSSLPSGSTICAVRMLLTDDADTVGSTPVRTSAMIDYVQLGNAGSPIVFWQENF